MKMSDIRTKMQEETDEIINDLINEEITISESKQKFGAVAEQMLNEIDTYVTPKPD